MTDHMTDHLNIERISALLDEPWADLEAEEHLEACETCRGEFEKLSRMRMAFSALNEMDPPADQWSKIDASLDEILGTDDIVPIESSRGWRRQLLSNGPLQAAAALALFAGGIFAGVQVTGGPASPTGGPIATGEAPAIPESGVDREIYDALNALESGGSPLRQVGGGDTEGNLEGGMPREFDAFQAARLVAELDGYIEALRDRLEASPDDPFASGYLQMALERRSQLARLIAQSNPRSSVLEW